MDYDLHAPNQGLSWQSPCVRDGGALTAAQLESFDREGYLALEDVFSADELRQLLADIDPLEAEAGVALRIRPYSRSSTLCAGSR